MALDHRARAKGDEATHTHQGDQRVPQTLGTTQTHKRHGKRKNSVSRERHNKCYTREKGVWSGVGGGHKEED